MKQLVVGILAIFLFSSCEKVIDVKLKNSEPMLVIEGLVDDAGNPAKVTISKSVPFGESNIYPKVSGAVVTIADDEGNRFVLAETATGIYTNNSLQAVVGRTYSLSVVLNGKTFTALSTVPRKMAIRELVIDDDLVSGGPGNELSKVVNTVYDDLPGFGDHAQVVQTINGKHDRLTHVVDDFYTDGGSLPVYVSLGNIKLKKGDVVQHELRFIDKQVYKYLSAVQLLNEGNIIPDNPASNISGGVLGLFSAHTSETKSIVIP
jgi:hypothetical protein